MAKNKGFICVFFLAETTAVFNILKTNFTRSSVIPNESFDILIFSPKNLYDQISRFTSYKLGLFLGSLMMMLVCRYVPPDILHWVRFLLLPLQDTQIQKVIRAGQSSVNERKFLKNQFVVLHKSPPKIPTIIVYWYIMH